MLVAFLLDGFLHDEPCKFYMHLVDVTLTFAHFKLRITPLKIQLSRKPLRAMRLGSVCVGALTGHIALLRNAFEYTGERHPLTVDAIVILPRSVCTPSGLYLGDKTVRGHGSLLQSILLFQS